MYIQHLDLHKFRNIKETSIEFSSYQNFIFGDNAQGKTNLIEAIYLLCLAKSFRTRDDKELVPFQENEFLLEGAFRDNANITHKVVIHFTNDAGKNIKVNSKKISQFSKLVGQFPIVTLASQNHVLTDGGPAHRRQFFNILLSQSSRIYLENLRSYDKVVKQRNQILTTIAAGNKDAESQLEVWNDQLVHYGKPLIEQRQAIVDELNPILASCYKNITESDNLLKIRYQPNVPILANDSLETSFYRKMKLAAFKEKKFGTTLIGPHRDEFIFTIEGNDIRKYGSRGERKSTLVSLKAAESQILKNKTQTDPILLLDDLYAELDKNRGMRVLKLFADNSQTFITGTSLDYEALKNIQSFEEKSVYFMKNGHISNA